MTDHDDKNFEGGSLDVLGIGCAAVDDLLYVPSFPAADEKVQVERSARRFGGLTGAALVAAARQGVRCAYAGCLGTDEFSQCVAENFAREGISTAPAPRLPEARVVRSVIVVGRDTGSRNIFFQTEGLVGAHDSLPSEEVIRRARVLFIDHCGMGGNLRAARLARAHRVAVVADLEDASAPAFEEVLALVDHLVLSKAFALSITGQTDPARAALALWRPDRAAVIVTCGAEGCWSVSAGAESPARHHGAFTIKAADTTGCGDVFHGAYAARLALGETLDQRIRFAGAAAALKAMGDEIPRLAEVEAFLAQNGGCRVSSVEGTKCRSSPLDRFN
jgi:ribokinase